ncbi:CDGSH iron-sulfur domain-containing protein [Streptomyces sp. NPDC058304]
MRGDLRVTTPDGTVRRETRAMLCACGVSGNQPFCDHSGACGSD